MGFFDALSRGLERSREALNEVFYFGGEVDEDFWVGPGGHPRNG